MNFSVLSSDDSAMETHFRHCANLGQKMSASASSSTHEKLHPSAQFSPNTFSFETDRWRMHSLLHQHTHDPSPREAITMPPQTLLWHLQSKSTVLSKHDGNVVMPPAHTDALCAQAVCHSPGGSHSGEHFQRLQSPASSGTPGYSEASADACDDGGEGAGSSRCGAGATVCGGGRTLRSFHVAVLIIEKTSWGSQVSQWDMSTHRICVPQCVFCWFFRNDTDRSEARFPGSKQVLTSTYKLNLLRKVLDLGVLIFASWPLQV